MKERIVITQDWLVKDMKAGVPELDKLFICQKVEQMPESFADVKQLTKELIEKIKLNKDVWKINIQEHFIDIQKMYVTYRVRFTDIGNILFDSYLKIAENKTAAEMWAIIKSLIGEE